MCQGYYVVSSIFRGRSDLGPSLLRIEGLCNDDFVPPQHPALLIKRVKTGAYTIIRQAIEARLRPYTNQTHLDLSFYLSIKPYCNKK